MAKALPPAPGPWGRGSPPCMDSSRAGRSTRSACTIFRAWNIPTILFIAGGLGAYLARLADGLPIRLAAPARAIDWSGPGIRDRDRAPGRSRPAPSSSPCRSPCCRRARSASRRPCRTPSPRPFTASRRASTSTSFCTGRHSPFRGADRLASLPGTRRSPPGLMTCHRRHPVPPLRARPARAPLALDGRDRDAPARFAREVLAEHFGHRALADLSVPARTAWRHDPLSPAPPGPWCRPAALAIRDPC